MKNVIVLVFVAYGVVGVPLPDLGKEVQTFDAGASAYNFRYHFYYHWNVPFSISNTNIETHDGPEVQIHYLPPISTHNKDDEPTNNSEIVQSAKKGIDTFDKPDEKVNEVTQNHRIETNKSETPDKVSSVIATDQTNQNNTELSKTAVVLEFPDRIGTPAIISLQGPPGK